MVAAEQQRVLANMIGRIHERTILDVGTGSGARPIALALGAADVTAIDSSEALLDEARRRAAAQIVKVNFVRAIRTRCSFRRAPSMRSCASAFYRVRETGTNVSPKLPRGRSSGDLRLSVRQKRRAVALRGAAARRAGPISRLGWPAVEQALRAVAVPHPFGASSVRPPMWFQSCDRLTATYVATGGRAQTTRLQRWGTPVTICAERAG